jgi:hypothetical protein
MDRRNFLGLLVAGAATPLLPALADTTPPLANTQIWTAETLAIEMEKLFACRMGPAAAIFDMVMDVPTEVRKVEAQHPVYPNQTYMAHTEPTDPQQRYAYHTYGFAVEGGEAREAEHRLAREFYARFSQVEQKNLVWRRKPLFETQEVAEYGATWATREQIEDGFVDLTDKPPGVELDPNWGNYRYVTRKYPLHRMTMRLAFTDQPSEEELTSLTPRPEGATLPRI